MFTVGDFARLAKAKGQEALEATKSAAGVTGTKASEIADLAKQVVAGAFPASNNTVNERTVDVLTVVAGLEQRVDNLEEVCMTTVEVDHEQATVRAQGLFAQLKARREALEEQEKEARRKEKEAKKEAKKEQAAAAKAEKEEEAPAPKEQPIRARLAANAPVGGRVNAGKTSASTKPQIRFDAVPRMERD